MKMLELDRTSVALAVGVIALSAALVFIRMTLYNPTSAVPNGTEVAEQESGSEAAAPLVPPAPPTTDLLEQKWGIQLQSLALARSGSAVDMRYTVLDPEKLVAFTRQETNSACLMDPATGQQISLSHPEFAGPGRTHSRARALAVSLASGGGGFPPLEGKIVAGRTYSVLVPNVGATFKQGSKAAALIGGVEVDDLVVE